MTEGLPRGCVLWPNSHKRHTQEVPAALSLVFFATYVPLVFAHGHIADGSDMEFRGIDAELMVDIRNYQRWTVIATCRNISFNHVVP